MSSQSHIMEGEVVEDDENLRMSNASLLGIGKNDSSSKLNLTKMNTELDKRSTETPKQTFFSMATVVDKSPTKTPTPGLKNGLTFIPSPVKLQKADTFLSSLNQGPDIQKRRTEVFVEDTEDP